MPLAKPFASRNAGRGDSPTLPVAAACGHRADRESWAPRFRRPM